ncbi:hypothetical protein Taro_046396, partial [Colocasia esculenta]|nr:hypothetical protein [Colocasia esculenta]
MSSLHGLCVRSKLGSTTPSVVTSWVGYPRFSVSQARCARGLSQYLCTVERALSWGTDIDRCIGPQLVLFPVPHFRKLEPESLKVS